MLFIELCLSFFTFSDIYVTFSSHKTYSIEAVGALESLFVLIHVRAIFPFYLFLHLSPFSVFFMGFLGTVFPSLWHNCALDCDNSLLLLMRLPLVFC